MMRYEGNLCRNGEPRYFYSAKQWAVSLVRWGSIANSLPCGSLGNFPLKARHAVICVEGVENNEKFIKFAHFTGADGSVVDWVVKGFRTLRLDDPDHPFDYQASKTWVRGKKEVSIMMANIDNEHGRKLSASILGADSLVNSETTRRVVGGAALGLSVSSSWILSVSIGTLLSVACPPVGLPFLILGVAASSYTTYQANELIELSKQDNFFKKKHNCFTWAREKFKFANIDLSYTKRNLFFTSTTEVTDQPNYGYINGSEPNALGY